MNSSRIIKLFDSTREYALIRTNATDEQLIKQIRIYQYYHERGYVMYEDLYGYLLKQGCSVEVLGCHREFNFVESEAMADKSFDLYSDYTPYPVSKEKCAKCSSCSLVTKTISYEPIPEYQHYYQCLADAEDVCEEKEDYSLRYHNITKCDMKNGDGLRVVLWVAGCEHKCKECHNPITWDVCGGIPFTKAEKNEIAVELSNPYIEGITFSGGDPMHPQNRADVSKLIDWCRREYPYKTIWLYTGYNVAVSDGAVYLLPKGDKEPEKVDCLSKVDVIVDGPFLCDVRREDIESKRKVYWRGSSNQRVIDVKASLTGNQIVVRED